MKTWLILVRKELRQHVLALAGLLLLCLWAYLNLLLYAFLEQTAAVSWQALRLFLVVYAPVTALVLAGRLVAAEYSARTQVFLEALPLARSTLVIVKYLLGLTLLLGATAAALLLALLTASVTPDSRQVLIMTLRGGVFVWTVYSFCFLGGFLGRYRFPYYILTALGLIALQQYTDIDLTRWGPFALVDPTLAFERFDFPWTALAWSAALALAFIGAAFALALTREGSVAALTAEKMSYREKIAFTMLILGFLTSFTYLDERAAPEPFQLMAGSTAEEGPAVTTVLTSYEPEEADLEMARHWSHELAALGDYLGLSSLPRVFIVERTDLDPDLFEEGQIQDASGVLARAHITHPDFRRLSFQAWLLRRILLEASNQRLADEEYGWVLDGFSLYWLDLRSQGDREAFMLRALWAAPEGVERRHLENWLSQRELLGREVAAGLAHSGLTALRQRCGPEGVQDFLRRVLAADVPRDFRALWRIGPTRPATALRESCGVSLDELIEEWNRLLLDNARQSGAFLQSIPRLVLEFEPEEFSPLSRGLQYRLSVMPPPPQPLFLEIRYGRLQGLEVRKDIAKLQLQLVRYPSQLQGILPGTYTPGERLYAAALLYVPLLGCNVVSGWRVQEVP
ncbi:MAG TPA: hypothetical protein VLU25_02605 [Acidobacteriota bacterium]|nr:hypothetical protein [Acidobacteriota bacterium]